MAITLSSRTFPKLVTPVEAAELLRISKSVIYRMKDARTIRFYMVSGSIRFSTDDLLAYLERQEKDVVAH